MDKPTFEIEEAREFDFYLQWEWPEHIETSLRRMLWISLVETSEYNTAYHPHLTLVRTQIATYPEAPPSVLAFLSTLSDPELRIRVAENPRTWTSTLASLSRAVESQVRAAVATNPRTTKDVLIALSVDSCPDVRYTMAENPELPAEMLHQLSSDDNPYVAHRAMRTISLHNSVSVTPLPRRKLNQMPKFNLYSGL